jgi:hypothetical protein
MLNVPERTVSSLGQPNGDSALVRWLTQVIELPQLRIKPKLRGNHLYLLCEGPSCPAQAIVVSRLARALTATPLTQFLPGAVVYQVVVYGRATASPRPDWAEVMPLDQLNRYHDHTPHRPQDGDAARLGSDAARLSPGPDRHTWQLARQGDVTAIAHCLSTTLSHLGVSVRAQVKPSPVESFPARQPLERQPLEGQPLERQPLEGQPPEGQRLLVLCESHYSPEASLIAPAIAQKLRELQLPHCRTAVVFGQVQGETQPEWMLRVDLTPPGEMLQEWARWGDVGAITCLLNRALAARQVKVAVTLLETTLHITCRRRGRLPEKGQLRSLIATFFDTLAPQGIHAATIYGVDRAAGAAIGSSVGPKMAENPTWVDWLTLPAAEKLELTNTTLTVAQRGNLGAIAFLLTRLLNPDLKSYLATGGTRLQVRRKSDLLYIMADALICPQQATVTPAIAQLIDSLKIAGITGIRLYGRRAGQTRPLWSWAQDFVERSPAPRQGAEATPEFAASDAYVGDLLGAPGELVWQPQAKLVWQPEDDRPQPWQELLHQVVEGMQRVLIQTQLFVHATPSRSLTATEPDPGTIGQGAKIALVWGTLGLLLTLQTDWILGQVIHAQASVSQVTAPTAAPVSPDAPVPTPEETVALPTWSLKKSEPADREAFNGSGFTQSGRAVMSADATRRADGTAQPLLAAPLQQKAVVDGGKSPYPTLNAKQLDEKLVLYRQYVAKHGAPDVLITGSSRAAQGYPGLKIFNFGVNGSTAQVENLILRRVLVAEPLPKLIIWADGARALNSGRLDVTYNAIATSPGYKKLPTAPETQPIATLPTNSTSPTSGLTAPVPVSPTAVVADSYQTVNLWLDQAVANISTAYPQREQLKSLLQGKLSSVLSVTPGKNDEAAALLPQDGKGLIDVNGFLPLAVRFNPVTYYQKYSRVHGTHDGDYADFRLDGSQTEALAAIAEFTQARQIPLVFVNLPLTQEYLDPTRQGYEDEFQRYMMQASGEMGFTFRNLADRFTAEHDFFSDPSHLNRYGAFAVANHIAQDALIPWAKR